MSRICQHAKHILVSARSMEVINDADLTGSLTCERSEVLDEPTPQYGGFPSMAEKSDVLFASQQQFQWHSG